MSQIKIEITFDPKKETIDDALAAFKNFTTASAEENAPQQLSLFDTASNIKNEAKPTAKDEPKAETPAEVPAETPAEAPATTEDKPVSKTDIRAMATALSKKNKPALKAIFEGFGVVKLSDIPEDKYPELMRKMVEANA